MDSKPTTGDLPEDDSKLTKFELQQKYQWREHPVWDRAMWRDAVANKDTIDSYWDWLWLSIEYQEPKQ